MGYMTNVTFLNDHWHNVAADPQALVDAISAGMNSGTDEELRYDRGEHMTDRERWAERNYVTVHKAEHADVDQIIYTAANSAYPVHELAFGNRAERWINRWGKGSSNAGVRLGILRGVVNKLRWHADRLEKELDTIEKDQDASAS